MELYAVFPSLFAFLIAGLFGKKIGDKGAQIVTCAGVIFAALISILLFFKITGHDGHAYTHNLATWISSGDFKINWALRIDSLSVVMMCVINIVSACVHVYSVGYMSHDSAKARFMAYLSLFTFAMLMLVTADNLVQLFFGWEGVGVASYLLIGFWNHKPSANAAAMKAFIVNRVGDFGLALGLMAIFVLFGSVQFDVVFADAPSMADTRFDLFGFDVHALTMVGLLLFIGAIGKSAQLGLHTWLPDAMEGPTPVSALIHAATMVTAGVFLVARFSPLYEYAPDALMIVTLVGGATAFVAATIGMTQFDIKRVIAYSTMSQLGYMFFALGVSAYGAAMFHLMTHAFFKALLFLGAGSIIHAMSGEQDMRKMGGIWKKIPYTYALMWVGSLALAGIPFFSGYYSKDIILEAAWTDHTWFGNLAFWLGIAAAFMTAFYTWRVLFMTFHGVPRASKKIMDHVHESPLVMLIPLFVLAAGAVFAGFFFYEDFVGHHQIWNHAIKVLPANDTITGAHHAPFWVKKLPLLMGALGIGLAYILYIKFTSIPAKIAKLFTPLYSLFSNKWFFDELYNSTLIQNALRFGRAFSFTDRNVVDRLGPNGLAGLSGRIALMLSRFQSGYIFQYAFIMMIAVVGIISWFIFKLQIGS